MIIQDSKLKKIIDGYLTLDEKMLVDVYFFKDEYNIPKPRDNKKKYASKILLELDIKEDKYYYQVKRVINKIKKYYEILDDLDFLFDSTIYKKTFTKEERNIIFLFFKLYSRRYIVSKKICSEHKYCCTMRKVKHFLKEYNIDLLERWLEMRKTIIKNDPRETALIDTDFPLYSMATLDGKLSSSYPNKLEFFQDKEKIKKVIDAEMLLDKKNVRKIIKFDSIEMFSDILTRHKILPIVVHFRNGDSEDISVKDLSEVIKLNKG